MIEIERKMRNQAKLLELHPAFRARLEAVIAELETYGYRPRIEMGWLSQQEQAEAYRLGRTSVTYGFHNISAANGAKEALAADLWDDNDFAHQKTHFMLHLLAAAEASGLTTGLRWELPPQKMEDIDEAINIKHWDAFVYPGADPLHVEVTGLSIQEAKDGKRPLMPGEVASATPGMYPAPAQAVSFQPAADIAEPEKDSYPMQYKVDNLDTKTSTDYTLNTAFRPLMFLPVPYVSQLGAGAAAHQNDCGAAAAIMLLRAALTDFKLTPDEFYTRFAISGDPYLSFQQVRTALGSLGIQTELRTNLTAQDLFGFLAAGKPVIVLLRYKVFEEAGLTEKHYEGPHFAVVVGMDIKNIYLHDPLYTNAADGNAHAYPLDLFWKAWRDVVNDPNYPAPERSAIIPNVGIGFRLTRQVRVNISSLNIRQQPSLGGKLVGTLKKDQVVEIVRENSGWGEIEGQGWISLTYTVAA